MSKKDDRQTYEAAGVSIDRGEAAVRLFSRTIRSQRPEVIAGIGGFYGAFRASGTDPVLVAGADGVGTKLLVAAELCRWDTVGIDLVAMNVNDILTAGAEPLFFLDYIAVGRLDPEQVATIVGGVDAGCVEAGCALLGGETAEMPGLYQEGHADLAGFAVGRMVDRPVPEPPVSIGAAVIGVSSSGFHSNGYSLIRKVMGEAGIHLRDEQIPGGTLSWADYLMTPTRIYVKPILDLLRDYPVAAMAHITGGGIPGNLPRVLRGLGAKIDQAAWAVPLPMQELAKMGNIPSSEMARVFNLGIGFCVVVPAEEADAVASRLSRPPGWWAGVIGQVADTGGGVVWG